MKRFLTLLTLCTITAHICCMKEKETGFKIIKGKELSEDLRYRIKLLDDAIQTIKKNSITIKKSPSYETKVLIDTGGKDKVITQLEFKIMETGELTHATGIDFITFYKNNQKKLQIGGAEVFLHPKIYEKTKEFLTKIRTLLLEKQNAKEYFKKLFGDKIYNAVTCLFEAKKEYKKLEKQFLDVINLPSDFASLRFDLSKLSEKIFSTIIDPDYVEDYSISVLQNIIENPEYTNNLLSNNFRVLNLHNNKCLDALMDLIKLKKGYSKLTSKDMMKVYEIAEKSILGEIDPWSGQRVIGMIKEDPKAYRDIYNIMKNKVATDKQKEIEKIVNKIEAEIKKIDKCRGELPKGFPAIFK